MRDEDRLSGILETISYGVELLSADGWQLGDDVVAIGGMLEAIYN